MIQKNFELDFKNNSFDAFTPFIDIIKYKTSINDIILCINNDKTYSINNENILSVLNKIYSDFKNEKVNVQIIEKQEDIKQIEILNNQITSKSVFPFKYVFKYASLLFKNKI